MISANFNKECLLEMCRANHIQYVEFCFSDFLGNRKAIIRPVEFLEKDLEKGIPFDGSSVPGCRRITSSDMILIPDLESSVRKLPWTYDHTTMVRVMCTMHNDKETPYCSDPRAILKRERDELLALGYHMYIGPEIEFHVFEKNAKNKRLCPIDKGTYADGSKHIALESSLVTIMHILINQLDLRVERLHHEVGEAQYELSFEFDDVVQMADALVTGKHAISMLFENYDKQVSFMPKPLTGKPGSGMHLNFSLYDIENACNAFYDADDDQKLSLLAKSFIAGVLKHVAEFTLLMNPTVNSYKRLGGHEAPKFICCGNRNRSALIRLPQTYSPEQVRAEIRSPDCMCNPYLVFAALLRSGMEGIKHNYQLPDMVSENLYTLDEETVRSKNIQRLPQTLQEALDAFENSDLMRDLFGEHLFTTIIEYKKAELECFMTSVTDWELEQYIA